MKKAVRVIFILLLMFVTALTFVYVGMKRGEKTDIRSADAESEPQLDPQELAAQGRTLVIDAGSVALEVNQSHQCVARLDDGRAVGNVMWSCTDERIARIDEKGRVTAFATGSAELWAVWGRDLKARAVVTVYDHIDAAATEAVADLAASGSGDAMERVMSLARGISYTENKQNKKTAAVLKALAAFRRLGAADGDDAQTHWDSLLSAAGASGMPLDEKTLRQAALAAYCQGERDSSDFTISFTGDCTFASFNEGQGKGQFPSVYSRSGSVSYPFDLTRCVFGADDLTMINFEGALTNSRRHKDKKFYFRGDPSYVDILTSSSIEAVTLENNHSFDYFDTGFNDTIDFLRNAGVEYTSYDSPAILQLKDCRVVMLSMCLIGSEYTEEYREHVEDYVNRYRGKDTIIVMNMHWGRELDSQPSPYQIEAAHAMIDSGVDLIVGHHPHVLQGVELYEGHYIAYSLGNFSFGGNTSALNPYTVVLRASFARGEAGRPVLSRLSVVPCLTTSSGSSVNNYQPTPVYGEKGQTVADYLLSLSAKLDGGIRSVSWSRIP